MSTANRIQQAVVEAIEARRLTADVNVAERDRTIVLAMDDWQARFKVVLRLWATNGEVRVAGDWLDDLVERDVLPDVTGRWAVARKSRERRPDGTVRYHYEAITTLTFGKGEDVERLLQLVKVLAGRDARLREAEC